MQRGNPTFVCGRMSKEALVQSYHGAQLLFDTVHRLVSVAAEEVLVLVFLFLHEDENVC